MFRSTASEEPMRRVPTLERTNPPHCGKESAFIGATRNGAKLLRPFVELNGSGDLFDFAQHLHSWHSMEAFSNESPVLLIISFHSWQHNSHSEDVVEFSAFLAELVCTDHVRRGEYRVHGVYLAWREAVFKPLVERFDPTRNLRSCHSTRHYF